MTDLLRQFNCRDKDRFPRDSREKSNHSRTERENKNWDTLYETLYSAFLDWEAFGAPGANDACCENRSESSDGCDGPELEAHKPIICLFMHGKFAS